MVRKGHLSWTGGCVGVHQAGEVGQQESIVDRDPEWVERALGELKGSQCGRGGE